MKHLELSDAVPRLSGDAVVGRLRRSSWPRLLLDRTAVLAVGVVAGLAVGLSFDTRVIEPPVLERSDEPAQSTPQPAVEPSGGAIDTRVLDRVRETGVVRVGVFGDSFGLGVWEGLYDLLPREQRFEVLRFGKQATGFTRYYATNLEDRARQQLAADPIDVAVISFGANDAQPLQTRTGLQPFMSPGWQAVVGDRIDRFVGVARSTGATVFWLGLPAMRDPTLDANIRVMNRFYADHMRRLGVPFIDTRPLSVDAEGRYAAYLPDERGRPHLCRTPDGLHMLGIGYQRITAGLVMRIRAYADRSRATATAAPPTGIAWTDRR